MLGTAFRSTFWRELVTVRDAMETRMQQFSTNDELNRSPWKDYGDSGLVGRVQPLPQADC